MPKNIYRCDYPECNRYFMRQDLCLRHRERHTTNGSQLHKRIVFAQSTTNQSPIAAALSRGSPTSVRQISSPTESHKHVSPSDLGRSPENFRPSMSKSEGNSGGTGTRLSGSTASASSASVESRFGMAGTPGTQKVQGREIGASPYMSTQMDPSLQHSGILSYTSAIDETRGASFSSMRGGMASSSDNSGLTLNSRLNRAFDRLSGLGGSGAWPTTGFGAGTPNKDRLAFSPSFGGQIFDSMGELQSPSLGLGGNSLFRSPGIGSTGPSGRGSKLGPLFPPAMHEQTWSGRVGNSREPFLVPQIGGPGSLAARVYTTIRGRQFDITDLAIDAEFLEGLPEEIREEVIMEQYAERWHQAAEQGHPSSDISAEFLEALPEDIREELLRQDVQDRRRREREAARRRIAEAGGPARAEEMDADSFMAILYPSPGRAILAEQTDEVLQHLGPHFARAAHEPATTSPGNQWDVRAGPSTLGSVPPPSGAAHPPFGSSFLGFGTTLTAEQQNALKRRKQEEQYLMARQKEHLAKLQAFVKQTQLGPGDENGRSSFLRGISSQSKSRDAPRNTTGTSEDSSGEGFDPIHLSDDKGDHLKVAESTADDSRMFIPYTISEDRTGNQEGITIKRLAALGARCGSRTLTEEAEELFLTKSEKSTHKPEGLSRPMILQQ